MMTLMFKYQNRKERQEGRLMNVLNHFQHSILNDSTADLYTYKTHSQIWIDIAMEDIELSFDIQISKSLTYPPTNKFNVF